MSDPQELPALSVTFPLPLAAAPSPELMRIAPVNPLAAPALISTAPDPRASVDFVLMFKAPVPLIALLPLEMPIMPLTVSPTAALRSSTPPRHSWPLPANNPTRPPISALPAVTRSAPAAAAAHPAQILVFPLVISPLLLPQPRLASPTI
jgi:hypothetical protein